MRDWLAPSSVTALVAWIVIPLPPAETSEYADRAAGQHRQCALLGQVTPAPDLSYPTDEFEPLIPSDGGKLRVIDAHSCMGSMKFTHVIVEGRGGDKASVLVTRSPEASERTLHFRKDDFEVTQVRTTRRRGFVVIDRHRAEELRQWRDATAHRLRQFLRQLDGA